MNTIEKNLTTAKKLLIVSATLFVIMIICIIVVKHERIDWVKTANKYKIYEEEKSQMSLLPETIADRFVKLINK